jgi:hypothetical protein
MQHVFKYNRSKVTNAIIRTDKETCRLMRIKNFIRRMYENS